MSISSVNVDFCGDYPVWRLEDEGLFSVKICMEKNVPPKNVDG
jgi:hypothetical protein